MIPASPICGNQPLLGLRCRDVQGFQVYSHIWRIGEIQRLLKVEYVCVRAGITKNAFIKNTPRTVYMGKWVKPLQWVLASHNPARQHPPQPQEPLMTRPNPWTDDLKQRLVDIWAVTPHMSATNIGKYLGGLSKNQVLGQAHRLNLPQRANPIKPRTDHGHRRIPRKASQEALQAVMRPSATVTPMRTLTMSRTRKIPCCWVFGEKPDWRYCDEPSLEGKSYCPKHAAIAFRRGAA